MMLRTDDRLGVFPSSAAMEPRVHGEMPGRAVRSASGIARAARNQARWLAPGVLLGGRYRIGKALGQPGGFGATYLAWDEQTQARVAIKEFLPRALAVRADGGPQVVARPDAVEAFAQGIDRFLAEARTVAEVVHPAVVRVLAVFQAHGTAYQVMAFTEGKSLGECLSDMPGEVMDPVHAVHMILPVLEGLARVHDHGMVHCDIKPHNLYLGADGQLTLLDFGAAVLPPGLAGQRLPALSEGYAALELYRREGQVCAATDVYGVAATLYRLVTARIPPAALDRLGDDPLARQPLPGGTAFAAALRAGLALQLPARVATARTFRRRLLESVRGD